MKQTAWIIGASTGLGKQTAEMLAMKGVHVILSARNQRDLEGLCSHIRISYQVEAHPFTLDLAEITDTSKSTQIIDELLAMTDFPDMCFVLAGSINEKDEHLNAINTLQVLLQNNFTGPVYLINELVRRKAAKPLRIAVASSVAAARARGKNISYSTAKKALEQYCFGLMHSQAHTNTSIQLYRFGYMDTNLSYGQKLPFPAASVESIASKIISYAGKGPGLYYLPRFWFWITFVLNLVPFGIYKKLKF